jgi:predicted dehydrogenase
MHNPLSIRVLVIGAGSIGERHIRALRQLQGTSVSLVDPREERARQIADRYGCVSWFADLAVVPLESFDAAVIATPADSHVKIATLCTDRGLHVLIEKPLSVDLEGIDELIERCKEKRLIAAVGYVLRFQPTIVKLRELVLDGSLGRLLSVQSMCTHYLPASRPDYRQAYYGSVNAAAGVILDLSHELNYLEWIFGELRLEGCRRASVAELNIADEGIADLWLSSSAGLPAQIHLHAADRDNRRECHIVGSRATAAANLSTGEIRLTHCGGKTNRFEHRADRDAWHLDQARDFVDAIREMRPPRCPATEALGTLRVCLDAMRSPMLQQIAQG